MDSHSQMSSGVPRRDLFARWGAQAIHEGFLEYQRHFKTITARAKRRFETRDWQGHQRDARERLKLVSEMSWQAMLRLRTQFGESVTERALWTQMKGLYCERVRGEPAVELAETFFNSVSRRVFTTVGVDPQVEFVASESKPAPSKAPIYESFPCREVGAARCLEAMLRAFPFDAKWRSFEDDVRAGAERMEQHFGDGLPDCIELPRMVFYRGKGAYLIGRARTGDELTPFCLALLHRDEGIFLDAILPTTRDARVLFSFTRSYFHVDVDRPSDLVEFLRTVLPMRRLSELYISVGFNKHGKTQLYRELLAHLHHTEERFERAAGDRGLVMVVFTLPTLELVFKVIRDRFPPPKSTSREEVIQKYNLVFRQDRAGRLADAQEFEHLAFDKRRFEPSILEELLRECGDTVREDGDCVVLKHVYVERRVRPLNLYLREAAGEEAAEAVLDYGQSIRDLAATNTFPGDLLLKNFGVTKNRRVIFYDYDELSLVTECRFRELPTPRDDDEEMASEAWFYVDSADIFPEEFIRFLGFTPELERIFRERHGDLLTAAFWRKVQERISAGEILDIYPYAQERRLSPAAPAAH